MNVGFLIVAVFMMAFGIWFLIFVFKQMFEGARLAAKEQEALNKAQSSNVDPP